MARAAPILRIVRAATSSPPRVVLTAFSLLIALGTALLLLPLATDGPTRLSVDDALFMATSATTVTGLATIDIAELSLFGELVLLGLIQVGGFGIMTIGSVIALVAAQRVGLKHRLFAQAEIGAGDFGALGSLVLAIAKITVVIELGVAAILFARIAPGETSAGRAAYEAIFHAVSAFNNAGISLYSDGLVRYVGDPIVVAAISGAFIVGGLGFPILVELRRRWRNRRGGVRPLSVHAKITLTATAVLLVAGPLVVTVFEWTNPATLGSLDVGDKLLAGWFQGVSPRTAGFNTVDIGGLNETTLLFVTTLMFIGAGPASTSGGIKVTTFAVLGFVLWAEARGDTDVNAFGRRLPSAAIRTALTVALLAVGLVVGTSLVLMASDGLPLTAALFESTSAFGTVGLSTGVTGSISTGGHLLLVLVMLTGRVGPVTFAAALARRRGSRRFRYPEGQPVIG